MATIDVGHAGEFVRAMGFARNHSSGSDAPTPVRRKARRRTQPLASRECEATRPLLGQSESPLRRANSHMGTIAMTPRRVSKRERRALRARGSRCLGSSAGRRCDSRSYAWRSSMAGAYGSSGRAARSVRSAETSASRRCQLLAQLVGLVLALRAAFAGEQHAGGGDSGKTGEPDQLPARTHRFRRLLGW
jgi:hypothetical protein